MKKAFEGGDKVFVITEQRLATVLNVYGDGVNGSYGDIRLDLCGNTCVDDIEHYDPVKHAAFDHTFLPIMATWKKEYGITKNIPLRGKLFNESQNIGKARYVVNFHDGEKTHADGSQFFDIEIFSNKRKKEQFVRNLKKNGYTRI